MGLAEIASRPGTGSFLKIKVRVLHGEGLSEISDGQRPVQRGSPVALFEANPAHADGTLGQRTHGFRQRGVNDGIDLRGDLLRPMRQRASGFR
jgi:hypothetical protein